MLQGVSLEVNRGEIVCLIGRNGAGKTTTLRSIMGLTDRRRGRVTFEGQEILHRPAHARFGLGLELGRTVLLAAHGNSLRALVKHLDGISDDEIAELNIPTGIPLHYRLDEQLRPILTGGEYLDPEAAAAGAAAVAAQGGKAGA